MIISSNTSSAPSAVHSSRSPSRNPGAGSFAVAGSRIRHATWPGCSANRRRTDSRSLNRKPTVRSRIDCGMPAGIGVWPMNQSSVEKNGWSSQIAIRSRPVAARASLTAAVVTSEPLRANLTISQPTVSRNRSAAVSSIGRRADEVATLVEDRAHGLRHARVRVAQRDRPQPRAVLDVLVAVHVPDVAAAAARDDRRQALRILVLALGVGVGAAGHEVREPRGEPAGLLVSIGRGGVDVVAGHGRECGPGRRTPHP